MRTTYQGDGVYKILFDEVITDKHLIHVFPNDGSGVSASVEEIKDEDDPTKVIGCFVRCFNISGKPVEAGFVVQASLPGRPKWVMGL